LLLALAVAVLGLVQYFLGFSVDASPVGQATLFLLVGGLLAALSVLPKAPKVLPFAALFSVLGALNAIDAAIAIPSQAPGIIVVVLILGILQMLAAVGLLLLEYDLVKLPAAKPQTPQGPYGQQFGQGPKQQFGQQPHYGQQPHGQPGQSELAGQYSQPTQYSPPVNPGPGQQSTTYSPQQGQFFQQPPSEGEQRKSPGTPPGGSGQQS
jgi:hypothetical protein